jgi:AcrR family transcriptional regulator
MSHNKGTTEQRIIEAAVQLFSRQGFTGTSTRELARLAEVNEASLFRHFPRKQDLFWAALQTQLEYVRPRKELQEALFKGADPQRVVPLIVELLVHIAVYRFDLVRLLYVGFLELRPGTERLYRQYPGPLFGAINDYLQRCVKSGTLRTVDPSITTVAFASTILARQGLYPLLPDGGAPYSNAEEAVEAYSKFWLSVLLPVDQGHRSSRALSTSAL